MSFGPTELIIVLVIVLVIFGGSKLPKLARSLGQAKNEFEAGVAEGAKETDEGSASKPPTA
jgi:sec-independent protein translocase protein TatA